MWTKVFQKFDAINQEYDLLLTSASIGIMTATVIVSDQGE